jgi:general secretion pathway protein D
MLSDVESLISAPMTIVYDPSLLEAVRVSEGSFLGQDKQSTVFSSRLDNASGLVAVTASRKPETGGVSGAGKLLSASFRAKSPGPASLGFIGVKLGIAGDKHAESILYNAVVEIKKP